MKDKPEMRWWYAAVVLAGAVLVAAFYLDAAVVNWVAQHQNAGALEFMRNVSRVGDWPAHIGAGLLLFAIACWRGSKQWARIFAIMVIACAFAGVTARAVKIVTGRARPSVKQEAGWNGPRFTSKYHAFPSGHVAASTAFFTALALTKRRVGVPLLSIPLLIAAARIYLGAHHLSDVTFAAYLGGGCAVLAARRSPERSADETRATSYRGTNFNR